MNHNQKSPVEHIKSSLCKFGVSYDDQFVLLDDAKHIIGVDGSDPSNLIVENIENRKADKFRGSQSFYNYISTLVYDKDTGSLYAGYKKGHLKKYKVDTASKSCQRVKDYGDIGIGEITSSHRFLDFVFFEGKSRIKVLDLSTGELLPGCSQTSIGLINSLHVCVKSPNEIYLAVSGRNDNYSKNNTDLFDVIRLFPKKSVILRKYFSEKSINKIQSILPQPRIIKSQKKKIQKLTKKRDSYKADLDQMHSTNNDLKNNHDQLHRKIEKLKETNQPQNTQSKINYTVTITQRNFRFKNGQYLQTHLLVMTQQPKQKIQQDNHISKKHQNILYNELQAGTRVKDQAHNLTMTLDASKRRGLQGNVTQK